MKLEDAINYETMLMIKIKKSELFGIGEMFDKIKLNKIHNSNVRKAILKIVIENKKVMTSFQEDVDSIRKKFFEDFKDEDRNNFEKELNTARELSSSGKYAEFADEAWLIIAVDSADALADVEEAAF